MTTMNLVREETLYLVVYVCVCVCVCVDGTEHRSLSAVLRFDHADADIDNVVLRMSRYGCVHIGTAIGAENRRPVPSRLRHDGACVSPLFLE